MVGKKRNRKPDESKEQKNEEGPKEKDISLSSKPTTCEKRQSRKNVAQNIEKAPQVLSSSKKKQNNNPPKDEGCIENILDLDKLYESIELPPELKEFLSRDLEVPEAQVNGNVLSENILTPSNQRKSHRTKKTQDGVKVINCHQCKRIDSTTNVLTCGSEECRESYCIRCIRKYFVRLLLIYY
jgi:hypothetical protein